MRKKIGQAAGSLSLFRGLFLWILLLMTVPYAKSVLSPYVRIFLVWGGILWIIKLLREGKERKTPGIGLLLLFWVAYAVSIFLYGGSQLTTNIKALLYMGMIFLLFYGGNRGRSREEILREGRILAHVFLGTVFVLALFCFLTFLFSVNVIYTLPSGEVGYLGMVDHRLWGLYNANTGGALYATSILLTLGFIKGTKKRRLRIFYVLNLIVQFSCLVLSYSRTSSYALVMTMAVVSFLLLPGWSGGRMKKNITGYFWRACVALLLCVFLLGGMSLARTGLSYLPGIVEQIFPSEEGFWGSREQEDSSQTEEEEDRGGGILTGRPILWEAGGKTFCQNPLFGVTREGLYDEVVGNLSDESWSPDLQAGGVHNGYLTILISSGIVGSAILFFFFISLLYSKVRDVLFHRDKIPQELGLLLALILLYAIMELLEARILYQINIFGAGFWLVLGYVALWPDEGRVDEKIS